MIRKDFIPLLSGKPMTLREIAQRLGLKAGEIEEDLEHLARSLVHSEWRLKVNPATCRKCGFEFGRDKLHKPSKCPHCRATWLTEPVIEIVARD